MACMKTCLEKIGLLRFTIVRFTIPIFANRMFGFHERAIEIRLHCPHIWDSEGVSDQKPFEKKKPSLGDFGSVCALADTWSHRLLPLVTAIIVNGEKQSNVSVIGSFFSPGSLLYA
uniref:Uncharacterized protein n=1 Tax=Steinernema glaseri TaxID=37863 RepID=A0A1I8AE48_9BILA